MIELFRKAAKLQKHLDKQNKGKVIGIGFYESKGKNSVGDDFQKAMMSSYGSTRENEGKPFQRSEDTKQ